MRNTPYPNALNNSLTNSYIWHSYLFAIICGLFYPISSHGSLLCAILIFIIDSRLHCPKKGILYLLLFISCAFAATCYFDYSRNKAFVLPAWAKNTERFCGKIERIQGMPDFRLRIILSDVVPEYAYNNQKIMTECPPLPGFLAWTWENQQNYTDGEIFTPLPGQTVCLKRPILHANGFANNKNFDVYALIKQNYWRVWSTDKLGDPVFNGHPDLFARIRNTIKINALIAMGLTDKNFLEKNIERINFWKNNYNPQIDKGFSKNLQIVNSSDNYLQGKAILIALLFGDKEFLTIDTVNNFIKGSIAHSLALSGQHLCLAGLAGAFVLWILSRFYPKIFLTWPARIILAFLCLFFAIIYLWLGNAPLSLLRAFAMLFVLSIFIWRREAYVSFDIIVIGAFCLLLLQPLGIYDLSLQISLLCALILIISAPIVNNLLTPTKKFFSKNFTWTNKMGAASHNTHCETSYAVHLDKFLFLFLEIFIISAIIQIFLQPFFLRTFNQTGCWFLLNLVWLPPLAFIILPLGALGLIFLPFQNSVNISGFLFDLAAIPCNLMISLLNKLSQDGVLMEPQFLHSHWTTLIAFAVTGLALVETLAKNNSSIHIKNNSQQIVLDQISFKKIIQKNISLKTRSLMILSDLKNLILFISQIKFLNRKLLIIGICLLAVGPILRIFSFFDQTISIQALDVGQAQSILIKFPENGRVLIDGGGSNSQRFDTGKSLIAPYLVKNAAPKINGLINTHPDMDHLGGFFYLLNNFSVGSLFHNGHMGSPKIQKEWSRLQKENNAVTLMAGDVINLGNPENNLRLEVLHPPRSSQKPWKGNSASLVMRLVKGDKGLALFTGDAEKNSLNYLANQGVNLHSTLVFAPHHGSDRSLAPNFYYAASPELVIASCGYENRYNYPGRKLRAFLAKRNIKLLDTGNNGKIDINFKPESGLEITKDSNEIKEINTVKKINK